MNATSSSSDGAHYSSKEGAAGFAPQLIVTTTSAPADTTAPTPPTGLLADATTAGRINLSWTSSTDDVGVAGYKVFRDGAQIGTATTTSFSDLSPQPATTYSYTVAAYDAAGNTSAASDPASVTTAPDTTPPSAPGNVVATAVGPTQVNLSWSSSADDVGVASYSILRDGLQVGTSQTTSFADITVQASTTYSYTIVAVDRAGNPSAPSAAATATTPAPSATMTFTPTDDTYVQSDVPGSNFGTATSIVADNSPVRNVLLKFTVAGVGSRTVTSAKLRLFCVDGSSVGGTFRRVADTSWTEGSVTWNTAPAADTATIGSLGAVAAQTWYEVDVKALVAGDGTYSIKGLSTSTNGAYYSSKEGGFAPQLVITTS
jgi:chitodextrinase